MPPLQACVATFSFESRFAKLTVLDLGYCVIFIALPVLGQQCYRLSAVLRRKLLPDSREESWGSRTATANGAILVSADIPCACGRPRGAGYVVLDRRVIGAESRIYRTYIYARTDDGRTGLGLKAAIQP